MRLRTRSLLLLVIPLLLLMGVLVILGRTVVLRTAESVEQNDLRRTVQSVRRTVDEEIEGLGGSVRDWAVWDDTYLFASGKNPSYAETQLTADTFATLRLNLVAILDQEGSVLLSLLCEEDTIEPAELDGALRDSILHQTGATSGMAVVEGRPLLVAAHPIRTSADLGPTLGRLVFGRWLSPARVQEIGATIGADVLFATRGDPIVPAALSARLVAAEDAVVARRLGEERIAGYALYPAPLSTSSLVMRVEMPREAWGVARKSLAASRLGLLALALLTIAAVLFGLERFVLSRVAKLSREVRGIGSTGGFAGRVTEGGRDETGELAHSTNAMLAALESSHRELQEALAEVKTLGGLLPICAACKKIRDDDGYWHQVEGYLMSHTQVRFSHGLCPDCLAKYDR